VLEKHARCDRRDSSSRRSQRLACLQDPRISTFYGPSACAAAISGSVVSVFGATHRRVKTAMTIKRNGGASSCALLEGREKDSWYGWGVDDKEAPSGCGSIFRAGESLLITEDVVDNVAGRLTPHDPLGVADVIYLITVHRLVNATA
jgi:hypothetical protein